VIRQALVGTGGCFLGWSRAQRNVPLATAIAYSAFLQLLALLPDSSARPTHNRFVDFAGAALFTVPAGWRDLAHLPVYGLTGILWFWALNSREPQTAYSLSLAAIVASALGILTEVSQIPLPTRVFTLRDLTSNVAAATAGVLLASFVIRNIEGVSANPSLQRTLPGLSPGQRR